MAWMLQAAGYTVGREQVPLFCHGLILGIPCVFVGHLPSRTMPPGHVVLNFLHSTRLSSIIATMHYSSWSDRDRIISDLRNSLDALEQTDRFCPVSNACP